MKIGVFGRHPVLEPGFNGVMSINWLKGLKSLGVNVELILPNLEHHDINALKEKANVSSLDELEREGADFDIKVVKRSADLISEYDAIIWQSYRPQEDFICKELKSRDFFLVKNPPRVFTGIKEKDAKKAIALAANFDFVALSLKADLNELIGLGVSDKVFGYVPRGFDTSLLVPDKYKDELPIIGFDKAVKAKCDVSETIEHIVNGGAGVYRDGIAQFYSLRDNVESLGSQRVPNLEYRKFYKRFINRLHIYMPINFDLSVHVKGKVVDEKGQHRYVGLYENQVIETQLAGGLVLARRGDIPGELLMLDNESTYSSYDSFAEIEQKIREHLSNFEERSVKTRERALAIHKLDRSCSDLLEGIKKRL